MRRLHIAREILAKHRDAYADGILDVLTALGSGRPVNKKGKHLVPVEWIPSLSSRPYAKGWFCYLASKFAKADFLTMRLDCMAALCCDVEQWEANARIGSNARIVKDEICWAKDKMRELFNYDKFGQGKRLVLDKDVSPVCFHWSDCHQDWSAWHFIRSLHVGSCCYCNADTIFSILLDQKKPGRTVDTHSKSDYKRSPLDHYIPRSRYPYLALSLYNLVPACPRCNTNIKGAKNLSHNDHIYPYGENFDDGFRFFAMSKTGKKWREANEDDFIIDIVPGKIACQDLKQRSENTATFFHLKEYYEQCHKCDAMDIIHRVTMLPRNLRKTMERLYPGINELVLNRILIGSDLKRSHINRRPLSKLTLDLYEEFGAYDGREDGDVQ